MPQLDNEPQDTLDMPQLDNDVPQDILGITLYSYRDPLK